MIAATAFAAEPSKQLLIDKPISGDEARHGVTLVIDWPVGASVGRHTHPGDEFAVVLEGAVEVTTDGEGAKIYKAGEAYHNAKDVVHSARAVGDQPAKTIATLFVENGKPLSQPVK